MQSTRCEGSFAFPLPQKSVLCPTPRPKHSVSRKLLPPTLSGTRHEWHLALWTTLSKGHRLGLDNFRLGCWGNQLPFPASVWALPFDMANAPLHQLPQVEERVRLGVLLMINAVALGQAPARFGFIRRGKCKPLGPLGYTTHPKSYGCVAHLFGS